MNPIKKYAHILEIISYCFAGIIISLTYIQWLLGWNLSSDPFLQTVSAMPLIDRLLGLCVDTTALVIACYGIIIFIRLMKKFQEGQLFSSSTAQLLNKLSKTALYWALYHPLRNTLLSLITTLHKGPGNRIISISIDTSDIVNIFMFTCFVLITALIQEAYKIQQEHDLTV